jgi:hypothetical protein
MCQPNSSILGVIQSRLIIVLISLSATLFSLPSVSGADQPRVSLKVDEIVAALQALGDRAGPIRARWHEVVQLNPGAFIPAVDAKEMGLDSSAGKEGVPRAPFRFECPCELLLKDSWMRYSTKVAGQDNGRTTVQDWTSAYDGLESRFLWRSSDGRKQGEITKLETNYDSNAARLMPQLVYFRPFAASFGTLRKDRLRITKPDVVLKGRHCVLLDDGRKRIWIDSARACVPLAIEEYTSKGKTSYRAEIEYTEHPQLYWAPTSYKIDVVNIQDQNKINLYYAASNIVVSAGVSLEQRDFKLDFGPGSTVFDERGHKPYVIGANGNKQPIGRNALKLAVAPRGGSRLWYIVSLNGVCLVAIVIGWLCFRSRSGSKKL